MYDGEFFALYREFILLGKAVSGDSPAESRMRGDLHLFLPQIDVFVFSVEPNPKHLRRFYLQYTTPTKYNVQDIYLFHTYLR